jgi:hypothetical protein
MLRESLDGTDIDVLQRIAIDGNYPATGNPSIIARG